ncbi:hypothetical protein D3C73_1516200 [compost metagenome]
MLNRSLNHLDADTVRDREVLIHKIDGMVLLLKEFQIRIQYDFLSEMFEPKKRKNIGNSQTKGL